MTQGFSYTARAALAAFAAAMALPAGAAAAQPAPAAAPLFDATVPSDILAAARKNGAAVLEEDSIGGPMIRGRIDGISYLIFFLECDDAGENCRNIQFYASWDTQDVVIAEVNDWNINRVYGEALINEFGEPTLEMTVIVAGGVTDAVLEEAFFIWRSVAASFAEEVVSAAASETDAG